jgi:hypothetical protein
MKRWVLPRLNVNCEKVGLTKAEEAMYQLRRAIDAFRLVRERATILKGAGNLTPRVPIAHYAILHLRNMCKAWGLMEFSHDMT